MVPGLAATWAAVTLANAFAPSGGDGAQQGNVVGVDAQQSRPEYVGRQITCRDHSITKAVSDAKVLGSFGPRSASGGASRSS
jgi:hypothetical protein